MDWPRILAYVTGTVDQELLLRNEYLAAENRILREQVKGRLLLSESEKKTLAEIGFRLGRKSLEDVAKAARPDTILGWYRKLVAQKFDGSKARQSPGRPRVDAEIEQLIVRMAKENPGWGYDRIVGGLANHDTKYTQSFRAIIAAGHVTALPLPAHSPNLNAYSERWVRSVKEECLSKLILFGERSLRRALDQYLAHFHAERNHQGKSNVLLFPRNVAVSRDQPVHCRERLGGLLRYYHREAA